MLKKISGRLADVLFTCDIELLRKIYSPGPFSWLLCMVSGLDQIMLLGLFISRIGYASANYELREIKIFS